LQEEKKTEIWKQQDINQADRMSIGAPFSEMAPIPVSR